MSPPSPLNLDLPYLDIFYLGHITKTVFSIKIRISEHLHEKSLQPLQLLLHTCLAKCGQTGNSTFVFTE
jgi:hypothetical protein